MLVMGGCTLTPEKSTSKPTNQPPTTTTQKKKVTPPSSGVKITPYEQKEIKRKNVEVVVPQQKVQQKFNDGSQLPAFRTLMQKTQAAYKQSNSLKLNDMLCRLSVLHLKRLKLTFI
jgi:hypothetical protein